MKKWQNNLHVTHKIRQNTMQNIVLHKECQTIIDYTCTNTNSFNFEANSIKYSPVENKLFHLASRLDNHFGCSA